MYDVCFRKKVLSFKEKKRLGIRDVAIYFGISPTTVMSWIKKLHPKRKRNKPATKIDMEALKTDVLKYPDAYLEERAKRLCSNKSTVYLALKRLKITYKKNPKSPESRSRKARYFLP
jgi:transposase